MSTRTSVVRPAALSVLLLLPWGCGSLETQSNRDYPPASPPPAKVETVRVVVFSNREIEIIRSYYESHASAHGHGKKGQKGLPPGIAKNLERGKSLPPGIAKQLLPDDLRRALPPPPAGYDRYVVAGKVLLVELATQVVRDALEDVRAAYRKGPLSAGSHVEADAVKKRTV